MSLDISIPQKLKTKENFTILNTGISKNIKEKKINIDKKEEDVSTWLRNKRIEFDIEQKELAKCIGVTPVTICKSKKVLYTHL